MSDEQNTEELKALQLEREASEDQLVRTSPEESEAAQHERRAEKARYLREKLEDRERSERESADGEDPQPIEPESDDRG